MLFLKDINDISEEDVISFCQKYSENIRVEYKSNFDLTVEKKVENVPFVNYQYVDQDNKKIVSDLAIAQTDFMDKRMTFTLVSGSDGIDLSVHTEDK